MNMATNSGHSGVIKMGDRVTFTDGSDFRKKLFGALDAGVKHLSIDLSATNFMDSAGLGMLLVALKECQGRGASLVLMKPKGDVLKLLELTRSNERFQVAH